MSTKIKRLAKGTPIEYMMYHRGIESINGLTFERKGEFFIIQGFVVGDTEELGISVVAEDDENCCLTKSEPNKKYENKILRNKNTNKHRRLLRRGYYIEGEQRGRISKEGNTPVCPYNK